MPPARRPMPLAITSGNWKPRRPSGSRACIPSTTNGNATTARSGHQRRHAPASHTAARPSGTPRSTFIDVSFRECSASGEGNTRANEVTPRQFQCPAVGEGVTVAARKPPTVAKNSHTGTTGTLMRRATGHATAVAMTRASTPAGTAHGVPRMNARINVYPSRGTLVGHANRSHFAAATGATALRMSGEARPLRAGSGFRAGHRRQRRRPAASSAPRHYPRPNGLDARGPGRSSLHGVAALMKARKLPMTEDCPRARRLSSAHRSRTSRSAQLDAVGSPKKTRHGSPPIVAADRHVENGRMRDGSCRTLRPAKPDL